jgi:hypothetical protein
MTANDNQITKIGARLEVKLNLGNYNNVDLSVWIEDRVRSDDGSTSAAVDRLTKLLNVKLDEWAREFKNE